MRHTLMIQPESRSRAGLVVQGGAPVWRLFALAGTAWALLFVLNNFLTHGAGLPGPAASWRSLGLFAGPDGAEAARAHSGPLLLAAWAQALSYPLALFLLALRVRGRDSARDARAAFRRASAADSFGADARVLESLAAYIVRFAFWTVLLVGTVDMLVSLFQVQGWLDVFFSRETARKIGLGHYRGLRIHVPLVVLAALIAVVHRALSFIWLTLLIVLAELIIVIMRFVFSYEQPFMGDLVRFWYAALFLFAASYTLMEEGHVRVDVLYSGFSRVRKAWANALGCLFLGLPLCWIILLRGLWSRTSVLNAPILGFEISNSSSGLYVKYMMAGFLLVFSLSMLAQFSAYFLRNLAIILEGEEARAGVATHAQHGTP